MLEVVMPTAKVNAELLQLFAFAGNFLLRYNLNRPHEHLEVKLG